MNGQWDGEARGAWSAISRAPYLKAIALFPKGDCWNGGGLWTGPDRYWLNDGYGHEVLRDTDEVQRDPVSIRDPLGNGECLGVYYPRLQRDGWEHVERREVAGSHHEDVFERPLPHRWTLRKVAHAQTGPPPGKGCYWDEHALVHEPTGRVEAHPDWEWADRDGDRLVWAASGALHMATVGQDGIEDERVLRDFDGDTFEPVVAPY